MSQTVDVGQFIDQHATRGFTVRLVSIAFLLMLADGYDIAAIAFAAPGMIHQFQLHDMAVLGRVFSASLFGILLGAPIFGWVGDRFGRRMAIISACALLGVTTLVTAGATSIDQVLVLRLIAGFGLGGILPNVGALTAELAPRRSRATQMMVMFCGVSAGGIFPGIVAATLVPTMGWPILFWIGGFFPLVAGLIAIAMLPESVRYLVVSGAASDKVTHALHQIAPTATVQAARYVASDERAYRKFSIGQLFEDGLAPITLLLWSLFMLNLMGYFFLLSWTPTVLAAAHLPPTAGAIAGTLTQIGGVVGGLLLARPMERRGVMPIAVLFALAVPAMAAIGLAAAAGQATILFTMQFLAGFCILGLQTGINTLSGLMYPTAIRSNGSGWAFGVGRFGSVVGPMVGAVLIGQHLPIQYLYLAATVPFIVGAFCAAALAHYARPRLEQMRTAAPEALH